MSFLNSSSVYPIASLAATLAIGNPVAFDARADDLDTLGSSQLHKFSHLEDLQQTEHLNLRIYTDFSEHLY